MQVLFLKMRSKLEKGGDGSVNPKDKTKPADILSFPTELMLPPRGKLLPTYFNGFNHCNSPMHNTPESRMNHIRCMCDQERLASGLEEGPRGSKRPAPSSAEKSERQNLQDRFQEAQMEV
ncbi:hypothetical protein CYMTET_21443 [Cymbomonas tetramitiformis]|uniref:Uncharacterized protein n=1 Tax=Cymbomonas tetramitiformis TaxID=36881 RepID=A0AAE0G1Z4_9CHLO|nr:hypothetical protein CYMTET_21443 [Cymbomonas tetramitiformis]